MRLQIWRNAKNERYLVELDETGKATFASGPKTKLDAAYAIGLLGEESGSDLRWNTDAEGRTYRNRQLAQQLNPEKFVVEWEKGTDVEAAQA